MKKWAICLCLGLAATVMTLSTQAEETKATAGEKELKKGAEEPEKELKPAEVTPPSAADVQQRAAQEEQRAKKPKEKKKEKEPEGSRVYWKKGLRLDVADKALALQLGGLVMSDWVFPHADDYVERAVDELGTGVEFRRVRLGLGGELFERVEFEVEYDFSERNEEFEDVYLGLINLPVVRSIRVGHFKEPFSLEELTSCKYTTFMERSLINVFAPGRNAGVMLSSDLLDRRVTWGAGVFRETGKFGEGLGDYSVTGRITGLPWYEDKGRKMFHLGLDYSHRNPTDDILRYRQRPETDLAPWFVNTKKLNAVGVDELAAEAALVLGALSFQGEVTRTSVSVPYDGRLAFSGFYVMVSYFLTGENRNYKRPTGDFGAVEPKRNFLDDGGAGAWEIAARYSHIDLNDEYITGGALDDVTFGLNWYLNPYSRIMWNYVLADLDSVGHAHIFQTRFQLHF